MKNRQRGFCQQTSSAKAGISVRSGRRIEKNERGRTKERHWRTRHDPFEAVWETEILPLLTRESQLTGTTLWEYLDDHYPGQYPEKLLRTLQRRVKHWRAVEGPEKDVIFCQSVPAGQQGLSDFTRPRTTITIVGQPFEHLLYQFRLAYSHWRDVHIIQGGESYSALADGLQNALHKLGGAPAEHRTDSLSAAYINTTQKRELTQAYEALCQHYGMKPTVNNPGISHENGAIENAHGSLKHRIEQAIKVRGSADFPTLEAYCHFLDQIVDKLNKRCRGRLAQEQLHLKPLPRYRFMEAAKPQAFRFSQIRDDLLPTPQYHQLWARAEQQFNPQQACKWMVSVLRFAYDHDCETQLATELLQQNPLPELKALQKRFIRHPTPQPDIPPRQHTVETYDQLLSGNWMMQGVAYV